MLLPGWLPDYLGGAQQPDAVTGEFKKYNADISYLWLKVYVLLQFLIAVAITAYFLFNYGSFEMTAKLGFSGWIIFSTVMFGLLFEKQNPWMTGLELLRVALIPAGYFLVIA